MCRWLPLVGVIAGLASATATTAASETNAPPPALTRVPNALDSYLAQLYPWRDWQQIDTSGAGVRAQYTLRLAEYAVLTQPKTARGEDLTRLTGLPIEFVEQVRPAGAKGSFTGGRLVRVQNSGFGGSWVSYDVENKQDTPATAGEKVGEPLQMPRRPPRVDVADPGFAAHYARLLQQMQWLAPFHSNSRRASAWEGVVRYPKQEVPMRIRLRDGSGMFVELRNPAMRVRVHSGSGSTSVVVANGQQWDAAIVLEPGPNLSEEGVFILNESMNHNPLAGISEAAERSDQSDDTSRRLNTGPTSERFRHLFQSLRIRPIDANSMSVSALGLPETIFRRAR